MANSAERTVVLTGASGLVGRALSAALAADGRRCIRLVRNRGATGGTAAYWSPETWEIDRAALEGADAVVHLAGENVAAGRWTRTRMERIRRSRVDGTALLCRTLASLDRPPSVLVAASAVGVYGDGGDAELDESSPPGRGFLAEVCRDWEAATAPASQAQIRVVNLRIGLVLAREGGLLARMVPPFRLGLGGRLGDGKQWMSWIELSDLVAAVAFALEEPRLSGPVNAVAPSPVTNDTFTRALGRALGRPTILPMPAPLARLLFGRRFADEMLLSGQRVRPGKLAGTGFAWRFPELDAALAHCLAR